MGKRSERLRKILRVVWKDVPKNLEDFYTHIFWLCVGVTLYLMGSFLAQFLKVSIGGAQHTVGFPILFVYGVMLMGYVTINLSLRAQDADFHETKLGKTFVVLWMVEFILMAIVADIFPGRCSFPWEMGGVVVGVLFVLIVSERLKKTIRTMHDGKTKK